MSRLILLTILLGLCVGTTGVLADEPLKALPPRTIPLGRSSAFGPSPSPSITSTRLVGIARPTKFAELRASVGSPILEVTVRTGDRVKAGDVLVRFDDRIARAALKVAEVEATQKGSLQAATVKLQLAQTQLDRAIIALRRQAGSQFEVDEKQAARDQANAQVTIQRESLAHAQASLERAQTELSEYVIRAPFDGEVVQVHQKAGAAADRSHPVITVADRRTLTVELHLPLTDFGSVKRGQAVPLQADTPVSQPLDARVTSVSAYLNSASRTFRVELEIDNRDEQLPAGFTVRQRHGALANGTARRVLPSPSMVQR